MSTTQTQHEARVQAHPRSIRVTCTCGWTTRAPNMHAARIMAEQHEAADDGRKA